MDELHLLQQIALALVLAAPSSALDSSPDVSTIKAAVAAVIAIQGAAGCFNKGLLLGWLLLHVIEAIHTIYAKRIK